MKRLFTFLLCFALLTSFVGCTQTRDPKNEEADSEVKLDAADKEETAVEETDEPLLVYYVNQFNSGKMAEAYLNWYKLQEDALELEAKGFTSAEEL